MSDGDLAQSSFRYSEAKNDSLRSKVWDVDPFAIEKQLEEGAAFEPSNVIPHNCQGAEREPFSADRPFDKN